MLLETLEYLGIAFICSVLLIIMSKIILQALIRRPADYYNAEELRQEELMLNAGGISITKEHDTNPEGEILHETHLEAQLGDIEPAEPEEIIAEIPQSVHDSIEVSDEPEEPDAAELDDGIGYVESEEAEKYPDEAEQKAPEPEEIVPAQPEEQFGFSIKAKTSRTRKPKIREEEAAAEELEQAKAAMDEAKSSEAGEPAASSWTESYADIRSSLEHAFSENNSGKKNSGRRRAPSMNMNKKELLQIAASRGIEVPEEATKRQILDLIYSDKRKRY